MSIIVSNHESVNGSGAADGRRRSSADARIRCLAGSNFGLPNSSLTPPWQALRRIFRPLFRRVPEGHRILLPCRWPFGLERTVGGIGGNPDDVPRGIGDFPQHRPVAAHDASPELAGITGLTTHRAAGSRVPGQSASWKRSNRCSSCSIRRFRSLRAPRRAALPTQLHFCISSLRSLRSVLRSMAATISSPTSTGSAK